MNKRFSANKEVILSNNNISLDILNKYIEKLDYPMIFDDNLLNINENDLIEECEKIINNISKEIKILLIIKILLNEKNIKVDDRVDRMISDELIYNNNEKMKKLFENCNEKITKDNYYEIGKRENLDDGMSIYFLKIVRNICFKIKEYQDNNLNGLNFNGCI